MSWFGRIFKPNDENVSLNFDRDLVRQADELDMQQRIQIADLRMQGRELRQQMIEDALDIRNRYKT